MNFFGHSSGFLNIVDGKIKHPVVEVTGVKSLHSSEEDLENKERSSGGINQYGSLSRRQKPARLKNRKNNEDFRSVWYDEESEYDETDLPNSTEGTACTAKISLRKAASLDNLLDVNYKSRNKLTKNMISSPLRPRKIQGNWTETKDDVAEVDVIEAEEAFLALINIESQCPELKDQPADTIECSESRTTNLDIVDIDRCEVDASNVKYIQLNSVEVNSKGNVNFSSCLTSVENNEITVDIQETNETVVTQTFITRQENSVVAMQSHLSSPVKPLQDQEIVAEQYNVSSPIKPLEYQETVAEQYNVSSPMKPLENHEIVEIQCNMSSPIKPLETNEFIELHSFGSHITPTINEPKSVEMVQASTLQKFAVNKKGMKKGSSFENLLKLNTYDSRSNKRKKMKIDISPPSLPRKIEANVIDMTNFDTEEVTNLLKMKVQSKSTNELLKSFNQIKNEKLEHLNDPKFPISESDEVEGEVQIRRHQNINQYRYSKTTDFDFGRKGSNKDFEIRACTKIQIPNESSPIKLKKNEIIKYQNGYFYRIDGNSTKILRSNVTLKAARLLNKRDVELKDSHNLTYTIFFDNSKDAKVFIENEKVSCYVDNDSKSTITRTLLRLLGKRSSREVLEKKGIYQNEPIFGNTLRNIYGLEKNVPDFIRRTIELIESPENITSLGLYRTSGNLATIQKIRFEVDKGRLNILNEFSKDVDVLTGCLKLFFRELKEPLIPFEICDSLLNITKADKKYSKKDRDKIRSIINTLPEANSETLYILIKHLIEVVKYKDENKMDTYNLSVCWGPTIIFITDNTENANGKDLVTQSTDATRLFDALLTFYIENPEELDFSRKRQDYFDNNKNPIQRQDSKDSIQSSDSNNSKVQKRSLSNSSLNIDEVLKKSIELIELNIKSEGLYKKSGSTEKIGKIMKKMMRKKVYELEKYKFDTNELTDSLKKYLRDFPEPLVTRESVEQILKFCDNTPCLEQNNRQKIIQLTEDLPKKDMLIYLVRHIIKVMEHEPYHNVSKSDMIAIWTNVLNYQRKITDSNEKFSNYLRIMLEVFDETKRDIILTPKGIANGLLNDLKNYQKDKDRCSKYDNVPEMDVGVLKEATILEEKTEEFTKL